tara:strand:+ start:262 stop:984 length:723 start_codon:yes stop_codon:yes gene_type:complete
MDIIKKELFAHPRGDIVSQNRRALVIGATGATGAQLLSLLLESDNWEKITTISRKPVLNGDNHKKLNQILIDSFDNLDQTAESWVGHESFFNCIGTTRKIAGGAKQFVDIEFGISLKCAELASKAKIPNASVISAGGANANAWAADWIHPLLYAKTIGMKEETLTKHFSFNNVSIFRPGMLIRKYNEHSRLRRFFDSTNLGLPVKTLACALKRDAEAKLKESRNTIVYIGNKCIKSSILM